MATRNTGLLFNDDFSNLFNDTEVNFERNTRTVLDHIAALIESFKHEVGIQERSRDIKLLVSYSETVPLVDLEKLILQHLMPIMKTLLCGIFERIGESLEFIDVHQEKSYEMIHNLQTYINMCIDVQVSLNSVLDVVLQNGVINLSFVSSLPVTASEILLVTFEHCKKSDQLYKIYFDDIPEIVELFRKAQDVHDKLLKLLVTHLQFNFGLTNHITILINSVVILAKTGETLVDMNMKSLANTWKSFVTLIQKFTEVLTKNSFDVSIALNFIMSEILRNLENQLKPRQNNSKNSAQFSKITGFFIKILLKLYEIFWQNLGNNDRKTLLNFLMCLYDFRSEILKSKGYDNDTIAPVNMLVNLCLNPLLDRALTSFEFIQQVCRHELTDIKLLLLLVTSFERIPTVSCSIESSAIVMLVKKIFEVVDESFIKFSFTLKSNGDNLSLYDMSCLTISNAILSLMNHNQYNEIEVILMKNMLRNDFTWKSLLSIDIWYSVLRLSSSQLIYETLINIITLTETILFLNLTTKPELILVQHFLNKLYNILPQSHKLLLIENYPPFSNLHIWKCFGFVNFPPNQYVLIESVLVDFIEKVADIKTGKCNVHNFNYLCHAFIAITTLPDSVSSPNLQYLMLAIYKLWNFEMNDSSKIEDNALLEAFIRKLCCITSKFIQQFSDEELLMILTTLRQLLIKGLDLHIQTIELLNCLTLKSFREFSYDHQIYTELSEIFYLLLSNKNPIIKQKSLEVVVPYLNKSMPDHFIHGALRNDDLQKFVKDYVNKEIICTNTLTNDDNHNIQQTYKFMHKCPNLSQTGLVPKIGDENDCSNIKRRIKNDVSLFLEKYGQSSNSEKCFDEISRILSFYSNNKF